MASTTYRTNADGSITILGFSHSVRIGAREAHYQQRWGPRGPDGLAWEGPIPSRCGVCGEAASFRTRSEPRDPELVFIHYRCANCGDHSIEPFD